MTKQQKSWLILAMMFLVIINLHTDDEPANPRQQVNFYTYDEDQLKDSLKVWIIENKEHFKTIKINEPCTSQPIDSIKARRQGPLLIE